MPRLFKARIARLNAKQQSQDRAFLQTASRCVTHVMGSYNIHVVGKGTCQTPANLLCPRAVPSALAKTLKANPIGITSVAVRVTQRAAIGNWGSHSAGATAKPEQIRIVKGVISNEGKRIAYFPAYRTR